MSFTHLTTLAGQKFGKIILDLNQLGAVRKFMHSSLIFEFLYESWTRMATGCPKTPLGDALDFIDDLILMTYSMIRATNDPMKEQKAIPVLQNET
ncbi:unnamed protein product [Caenorhabditis brenneri]